MFWYEVFIKHGPIGDLRKTSYYSRKKRKDGLETRVEPTFLRTYVD